MQDTTEKSSHLGMSKSSLINVDHFLQRAGEGVTNNISGDE